MSKLEAEAPEEAAVDRQAGGLKAALEAILAVANQPVTVSQLVQVLELPAERIEKALDQLAAHYRGGGPEGQEPRGFDLRQVAGGWRLYSNPAFNPWVVRFVQGDQTAQLTKAALEVLAVIAYQQPVTRPYLASVRGSRVDGPLRQLLERELIEETQEQGAKTYRTSSLLLEKLGLDSLDQLPPLAPYLPDPQDMSRVENLDVEGRS